MDFIDRVHPERGVAGFTKLSGTVVFYSFVKSLMTDENVRRVLDFGAGRGIAYEHRSKWQRDLVDLRGTGAEVWACDIDPAVAQHPVSHHQIVLGQGSLPFADSSFDMIVSDWTFEHLADPEGVAAELVRILRPGGVICARTPNKWGYPSIVSRLIPNRGHRRALRAVQPGREARDVFPTSFLLNTPAAVRRHFSDCDVTFYRASAEPAYYFGSALLYRMGLVLHRLLPDALATSICFFIRKPGLRLVRNVAADQEADGDPVLGYTRHG